jgi:hypothetical protein
MIVVTFLQEECGTKLHGHFGQPPRHLHTPTAQLAQREKPHSMESLSDCDARVSIGQAPQRHGTTALGGGEEGRRGAVEEVSKAPAPDLQTESANSSHVTLTFSTAGGDRGSRFLCNFAIWAACPMSLGSNTLQVQAIPRLKISAVRMRGREKLVENLDPGTSGSPGPRASK